MGLTAGGALMAQNNPTSNHGNKFEALGTILPTPNEYRTASGAPGPKYWQQRADYDIKATLDEKDSFNEFHMAFAEVETVFLQSKKTGRWWMQLPDNKYIACSYQDYLLASSNEIPERWLRAQERP